MVIKVRILIESRLNSKKCITIRDLSKRFKSRLCFQIHDDRIDDTRSMDYRSDPYLQATRGGCSHSAQYV